MIAEKKNPGMKATLPRAEKKGIRSGDEFDTKRTMIREKLKASRVNYVVKDLPIY